MCLAVQDASIHPSQGGLSDKTTLQGQPGSGRGPKPAPLLPTSFGQGWV